MLSCLSRVIVWLEMKLELRLSAQDSFPLSMTSLPVPAAEKHPHRILFREPSSWALGIKTKKLQSWFYQSRYSNFSESESVLDLESDGGQLSRLPVMFVKCLAKNIIKSVTERPRIKKQQSVPERPVGH